MSDYDFDGGLKLKHQLLEKNKDKKKIVFIGGSNLALGLDSNKIQSSFPDYQIINYGHRFHYGLDFYISEIKNYLNKNDIIVIVPEYQLILDDYFGNQPLAKLRIENLNYSDFKIDISPRDFLSYVNERFRFLIKLKEGTFPNQKSHNRASAFNKFGDCNAHWYWENKKHQDYIDPDIINVVSTNYLKSFTDTFTKRGNLILLIPPMYEKNSYNLSENLVEVNVEYYKKASLNYAYPTDKMILDSKYFYDSPYHLLYEGIDIKTNIIISVLMKNIKERTNNRH
ncbi:hypothetical protein [Algibacter pectinivorans]|uniref:SGNH/GDSL hydrolase family protein n=1 Tax=Algibacter pectinivorans TaxID=870482 RepID=A0A1I1PDS0_9FLAO|nr:hypothetical protein [Algibacter pectinivorans]SFD07782.1 hypothetical protein SAMN04487987_103402 [Algibacter pectinivorans]